MHTLAGGDGGLKAQAVDMEIGTLDTLQVVKIGRFALLAITITTALAISEMGVTDVFPGLLTIKNALLDLVDRVRPLHTDQDSLLLRGTLFDFSNADETASQQVVIFAINLDRLGPVFGQSVDDQSAVQDRAGALFVQRHQRGDQVDVGARRLTGERLKQNEPHNN